MTLTSSCNWVDGAPSNPKSGDVYYDEQQKSTYMFDGQKWQLISGLPNLRISIELFNFKTKEDILNWYNVEYCLEKIEENKNNIVFCKCKEIEPYEKAIESNPDLIRFIDIEKFPQLWSKYILMIK